MERLYLKPSLCKAIAEYCEANNIDDVNAFANRCTTQGFNIVKYGLSPSDNIERENNGIKDFKNEKGTRKKKGRTQEEDISPENEGEQAQEEKGVRGEESSPTEETRDKVTTVRKIRIIKKR